MVIIIYYFLWFCSQARAMASSFTKFLDHTKGRDTFGRTPLEEWSVHCRDLYLTTHNRQTSMPLMGFEPNIAAGERPYTYALDHAATGTGNILLLLQLFQLVITVLWPVNSHHFFSPAGQGHIITDNYRSQSDTRQWVGFLLTSDQPDAEICPWQHTTLTTDGHPWPPAVFQPSSPSNRSAADPRLRPCGHWDRPYCHSV
jgi:hypothetical protein